MKTLDAKWDSSVSAKPVAGMPDALYLTVNDDYRLKPDADTGVPDFKPLSYDKISGFDGKPVGKPQVVGIDLPAPK